LRRSFVSNAHVVSILSTRRPEFRASGKKIRARRSAGLDYAITLPTHAPRMFDPIRMGKAEFTIDISTNFIGVKQHRPQYRLEDARKSRLAGPRKAHDQNPALHWVSSEV
jgi:hypothetical protein